MASHKAPPVTKTRGRASEDWNVWQATAVAFHHNSSEGQPGTCWTSLNCSSALSSPACPEVIWRFGLPLKNQGLFCVANIHGDNTSTRTATKGETKKQENPSCRSQPRAAWGTADLVKAVCLCLGPCGKVVLHHPLRCLLSTSYNLKVGPSQLSNFFWKFEKHTTHCVVAWFFSAVRELQKCCIHTMYY